MIANDLLEKTGTIKAKLFLATALLLAFTAPLFSQDAWRISGKGLHRLRQELYASPSHLVFTGAKLTIPATAEKPASDFSLRDLRREFGQFSPSDMAFFCRIEYRMEKALRFPVKVRLGEVQYVEEMEGKLNSMKTSLSRR